MWRSIQHIFPLYSGASNQCVQGALLPFSNWLDLPSNFFPPPRWQLPHWQNTGRYKSPTSGGQKKVQLEEQLLVSGETNKWFLKIPPKLCPLSSCLEHSQLAIAFWSSLLQDREDLPKVVSDPYDHCRIHISYLF